MRRGLVAPVGAPALVLCGLILAPDAHAQTGDACTPVGELASLEGQVELQHADTSRWEQASLGELLCERDSVRVGANSRGTVALINDAVLRLDQNTTVQLLDITREPKERSILDLIVGAFQSFSRSPRTLAVSTPYLNATIEGTEFALRVEPDRSYLTVLEGRIAAANKQGKVQVAAGETVVAEAGKAPVPYTLVKPRDAVQWALYYPPILAVLGGQGKQAPAGVTPPLAEALALGARRNVNGALEVLDRVPEHERDARYYLYRSAIVLSVGRASEAQANIDRALAIDPQAGLAYALRSIIEVVQNQKDQALTDAEQAVKLNPKETAPKIALSYAQQAHFNLAAARDTLLQATVDQPQDALAWARLSELWLMLGERAKAREAAERATSLAPDIERAQVVRGFADLAEFRTDSAKDAFTRAAALDSADPLPRLGRGLALIHEGALERGRRELEIAAGLDSGNALLRAYLGKAYYEEKRSPLDAEQFSMAKELDPLDPTAYLYDAIRKQTENRPVEAMHDLQDSIALNDNRAIYRSRQLLDQDLAARGTSLARIYNDLGFQQLGFNEATKSLSFDPGSAAAHRFLSDTYQGTRRHEQARVSELLQAQMLQDVNINPVQPSLSETNLNIVTRGGPTDVGFNEFTPLFASNGVQFDASGVAGNEDTFGGEGVVSALYDGLSLSGGAFHYETDGWRSNNDLNHDIYNLYGQYAISPDLNVEVELRHRDTDFGDLAFNFDPNTVDKNLENNFDQDLARAGIRYSLDTHSDFLLSYIYTNRDGSSDTSSSAGPIGEFKQHQPFNQDSNQVDAQYIFRSDRFNVQTGFSYSNTQGDESIHFTLDFFDPLTPDEPIIDDRLPFNINDYRGYVYANITIPDSVIWTVGLSYVDFDEDHHQNNDNEISRANPKVGVQWYVTPDIRLRAAYIENVKPALASNRTLEPTQVAGFNQLFDEANGTRSTRYGVGADWQITPDLAIGGEATWREVNVPFIDGNTNRFITDGADEQLHDAYIYWTPFDELAVRAGFAYDKYKKDSNDFYASVESDLPLEVETISVPVGLSYFHPSGFFATAGATFVDQNVDRLPQFDNQGHDNFFVVDLGVGYRFPKRIGIAGLQVQNLLDEGMHFQDDSFREFQEEPTVGPYFPHRTILGRVVLNF